MNRPETFAYSIASAHRLLALGRVSDAAAELAIAKEQIAQPIDAAVLLDTFGALLTHMGQLGAGLDHHIHAARIAREDAAWDGLVPPHDPPPEPEVNSANPESEARALANAGALAQLADRPAVAERALRRAAQLLTNQTNNELRAEVLHNLGVFLMAVNLPGEAIPFLEEALTLDRARSDARAIHGDLLRLAAVLRRERSPSQQAQAAADADEAITLAAQGMLGATALAEAELARAALHFSAGATLEAMEGTRRAIDVLEIQADDRSRNARALQLGRAYVDMAIYARRLKRFAAARESLGRAAQEARAAQSPALISMIARERAQLPAESSNP